MQHPNRDIPTNIIRKNLQSFKPVTLSPYGTLSIPLGRYRDTEPEPEFAITYEPALPYEAAFDIVKLPLDNGSYTLTAQIQSFHHAPVVVLISRSN